MASDDPIGKKPQGAAGSPGGPENGALCCEEWESLAAEALDGSLGEAQAAAFEQHRRQCPACAEAWEQSRRGAEWLRFLDGRPQPPAGLAEAILAATSGNLLPDSVREPAGRPLFWRNSPPALRGGNASRLVAPRPASSGMGAPSLFMTAAMAFFSLALTLSLLSGPPRGVSATAAHSPERSSAKILLSSLSPSSIGQMATRQYYSLQERGAKFYDNLPLVRELEAETRTLSISNEAQSGGGTAPARQGGVPRSRNGGAAPLPPASPAVETAVNWTAANWTWTGRLRLLEHPSLNRFIILETHRLAKPGLPYWSRA